MRIEIYAQKYVWFSNSMFTKKIIESNGVSCALLL